MKKRDRKLLLHRETVRRLDRDVVRDELGRVVGNGPHTSEAKACCGVDPKTKPLPIDGQDTAIEQFTE